MYKTGISALLLLASLSASAQHDNYLLRDLPYGKKVAPATPPRAVYEARTPANKRYHTKLSPKYPKQALLLAMEGDIWMSFDINPDGTPVTIAFVRDSLGVGETDPQKLATDREPARQAMIEEARKVISQLRLPPTDSVRHFQFPFRYRIR